MSVQVFRNQLFIQARCCGEKPGQFARPCCNQFLVLDYALAREKTREAIVRPLQDLNLALNRIGFIGKPASETFRAFEPVPQLLKNVRVGDANAALAARSVTQAIAAAEVRLGTAGRILVRKSGTEPLIRVMAEGDDSDLVRSVVDQIIEAIPRQAA